MIFNSLSTFSVRKRGYKKKIIDKIDFKNKPLPISPLFSKGIVDFVKTFVLAKNSGIYYFTNNLSTSCTHYYIFEDVEGICSKNNDKLHVIFFNKLIEQDTINLLKERNHRIKIDFIDPSQEISAINYVSNRQYAPINILCIKMMDSTYVFPLYNSKDIKKWSSFTEQSNLDLLFHSMSQYPDPEKK